jgi:hypothetical protein
MRFRDPLARLLADLAADPIFLPVKRSLLPFGDMAAVLRRHAALFVANLPVFFVHRPSLGFGYLACLHLPVDAPVLVSEALIDFGPARMVLLPLRFGSKCHAGSSGNEDRDTGGYSQL